MKTINVSISEGEFEKLGLKSTDLTFTDLVEVIGRELTRQRLMESVELAEKYGLSSMTIEEITHEVNETRKDAKNRA